MPIRIDRPLLFASGFIVLILLAGTAYTLATEGSLAFLSPGCCSLSSPRRARRARPAAATTRSTRSPRW